MGERKGQNKYYPPDFDYKVHKSLSGYHGQHALRERARKIDQGILIIRFEMPYNIWCDKCENHIGMGVRYNAEKSKIGNYYTTPIFKFRMKCHLCSNHFEIKTDPGNHDYVIISGARRKEQRWDPHENGQIVPEDKNDQKKLVLDSMYKLEHSSNDQDKAKSSAPRLAQLMEFKFAQKDDFLLNQMARKQLRESKKSAKTLLARDGEIKKRLGIAINLLPESEKDLNDAKLMKLSSIKNSQDASKEKRKSIEDHLLFGSKCSQSSSGTLSAKEVSINALCKIANSDSKRKRSEAFSFTPKAPVAKKPNLSSDLAKNETVSIPSLPSSSSGDIKVQLTASDSNGELPTVSSLHQLMQSYDGSDSYSDSN